MAPQISTSSSGRSIPGRGSSRTTLIQVKIVAFAPMPKANVICDREGEAGPFQKHPDAVSQVLPKGFHNLSKRCAVLCFVFAGSDDVRLSHGQ